MANNRSLSDDIMQTIVDTQLASYSGHRIIVAIIFKKYNSQVHTNIAY